MQGQCVLGKADSHDDHVDRLLADSPIGVVRSCRADIRFLCVTGFASSEGQVYADQVAELGGSRG